MDHYLRGLGHDHDSRPRVLLLWHSAAEERTLHALGRHGHLQVISYRSRCCTYSRPVSLIVFQWFFWGYSLTFSQTGSVFIGDLANIGMKGVVGYPSVSFGSGKIYHLKLPAQAGGDRIPDLLYAFYQ
jgi:ammonia channel protein AmtB